MGIATNRGRATGPTNYGKKRKMTKAQAIQIWESEIKPTTVFNYGTHDKSALRDSWKEFVSDLEMNGYITERQKSTWTPPKV